MFYRFLQYFFYKSRPICCLVVFFYFLPVLGETSPAKGTSIGEPSENLSGAVHSDKNLSKASLKTNVNANVIGADYSLYVGTALLRGTDNKSARFPGETFILGIGRKSWENKELYISFRPLKEEGRKIVHLEFLTRLSYFFSLSELKNYMGMGMGFGVVPYHMYSRNKNINRILSLSAQLFAGFRWVDLFEDFGFFGEINFMGSFLPFFVFSGGQTRHYISARYVVLPDINPVQNRSPGAYTDMLLNVGILYNF